MANEQLIKAIDAALSDLEPFFKGCIDIAGDASTTADAAVNQAPKGKDDASRGAGRPKAISDVPDTDKDGKRAGNYDDDISEETDEDEPKEVSQVGASTQVSKEGRLSKSLTDAEYAEYQELKKAQGLQSMEQLIKAEIAQKVEPLQKAFESVKARNVELETLVKSIAKTPRSEKSVVGIEQLQKSVDPANKAPEVLTKAKLLDVAEKLHKAGKLPEDAIYEIDATGSTLNLGWRRIIEQEIASN